MICIFTTSVDYSTTEVIRWLHHLGRTDVMRVNYNDPNSENTVRLYLTNNTFYFKLNHQVIHLDDIKAVWYRKGMNWLCDEFYPVTVNEHAKFSTYFNNKLRAEEFTLSEYIHHIIEENVPVLGSAKKSNLNKLLVLSAAKDIGFLIPDFYITNNRKGVEQVFSTAPDLITKSISDGLYLFENAEKECGYFTYTEKLNSEIVRSLPDKISPSFLQKNICKQYECRVFFLHDKCYAMAILSQADEQTKIDFRKYNEARPNRNVPFKLPEEIDQKIHALFEKIGLNTGSVDLIVDQDDNFYFLEINPVGQFGMVSAPCNYYLEKAVALNLIENATNNRTSRPLKYRDDQASSRL